MNEREHITWLNHHLEYWQRRCRDAEKRLERLDAAEHYNHVANIHYSIDTKYFDSTDGTWKRYG